MENRATRAPSNVAAAAEIQGAEDAPGQTTDAVIRTVEAVRDQKAEMKKIEMAVTKIVAVAIGTAEDVTTDREADRRHLDVSKHRNKSKVYIIMDYSFIFYFSFV